MRGLLILATAISTAACGDVALKAEGAECFATSQCEEGLTCDLGEEPPRCRASQTAPDPAIDAAPAADAARDQDASPSPDAAIPDAAIPDAAVPDAPPGA